MQNLAKPHWPFYEICDSLLTGAFERLAAQKNSLEIRCLFCLTALVCWPKSLELVEFCGNAHIKMWHTLGRCKCCCCCCCLPLRLCNSKATFHISACVPAKKHSKLWRICQRETQTGFSKLFRKFAKSFICFSAFLLYFLYSLQRQSCSQTLYDTLKQS